ncbi:DUF2809 domain-containing protein [Thiohalocapsa halophila]|uniref:ribosomal maturation YjgA family protein n=1 Tax=Thiohalocapsa halophila TaxID=69359 RepID=UPI00190668CF|nr:DUF2809 domain-containing protein [Thiohalocapsa halophila]
MSGLRCLALCGALVPLGLWTKLYAGPASAWVAGSLGGVLYVAFWIVLAMALAPAHWLLRVSLAVLVLTALLELLQLWHPLWLEPIRANFLGHALLGSTFSWLDFPHYALGAVLGARLTRWICIPKSRTT